MTGKPALVVFAENGRMKASSWMTPDGKPTRARCSEFEVCPCGKLTEPEDIDGGFHVSPEAVLKFWADDIVPIDASGKPLPAARPVLLVKGPPVNRTALKGKRGSDSSVGPV